MARDCVSENVRYGAGKVGAAGMRVALITGATGFTGRYMVRLLGDMGWTVHGTSRRDNGGTISGCDHLWQLDLRDLDAVRGMLRKVQPVYVVHLAAVSFVAHADVEAFYRANIIGTRNLLEACVREGIKPAAMLIASSANVYGNAGEDPLDENTPPDPANDYAVSKLAMEHVARMYRERLPIIIARPFNYTGVGQDVRFLIPKIVDHVRRRAPEIELGNLDVARDYSDVRVVVEYYRRLLECSKAAGETFNICSGRAYSLREILDMVAEISGHQMLVRVNPAFVRTNEVQRLVGDCRKLHRFVGVVQEPDFSETLRWMLNEQSGKTS